MLKDFLLVEGKDRIALLLDPPQFPRPIKARLTANGSLTWIWYKDEKGGRGVAPAHQKLRSDLCFEFQGLADGSDDEILRFAERWGPLGIRDREEEHVDEWRYLAVTARSLLTFACERATGGRVSNETWGAIRALVPAKDLEAFRPSVREQMAIAASVANAWFAKARGHRILDVVEGQFQIRPAASKLFGILAAQLAHAMSRSDQSAPCAGCKHWFPPSRRISRGSRQYCNTCRRAKMPQRDASRDYRSRKKLVGENS